MNKNSQDIFDLLDEKDIFDDIALESKKADIFDDTADISSIVKAEIENIKPIKTLGEEDVVNLIWDQLKYLPKAQPQVIKTIETQTSPPPQIIREVRIEVPKKDTTKYVEESKYLDLLVKLSKIEKQLKETRRIAEFPVVVGGPGVIGIPPPEPNPIGYVLTVNSERKAQWKAAVSGGGSSSDIYTTSNVTPTRSIDPTTSSLDQLYNVVASLIVSLQGAGIIQ